MDVRRSLHVSRVTNPEVDISAVGGVLDLTYTLT